MDSDLDFLQPYFLGPAGENDQLLESLVVEFLRDHAFWRRNFHPEDGFRIQADARRPVQLGTFIGSYTSLEKEKLPGAQAHRILDALGLDPATFQLLAEDPERDADHIFLLRHTLMNPWLLAGPGDQNYVDLYWSFIEDVVNRVLGEDGGAKGATP